MDKQHPEGLEFAPRGHGFTRSVQPPFTLPLPLLKNSTIEAVRKNHPDEWQDSFASLPARERDRRTGRLSGFTDDERERLATLASLVDHGFFIHDRMVVEGERLPTSEEKT